MAKQEGSTIGRTSFPTGLSRTQNTLKKLPIFKWGTQNSTRTQNTLSRTQNTLKIVQGPKIH